MKTVTIHTLSGEEANYDQATRRIGVMIIERSTIFTVEKPWLPNTAAPDQVGAGIPFKSAVPIGNYDLIMRDSPSKGEHWHFYNPELGVFLEQTDCTEEWHRYSTMFHVGNFVRNVVGCAAPGLALRDWGGSDGLGVSSSARALQLLEGYLAGEERAQLRII